ncbi:MAG: cell division protein FtsQ, partial [Candidatus Frackibacter sp. T328-2]
MNYLQRKEYFGLSLSLVIIIALLTFINSNYFALTKVTVKGNGLLTNEEIINFTGLNNGQNIFQIDFDKVSNRLMRQPQIKGVVLERRFPSTVRIIVDERTPLVVIQQGGDCLLVSKEGWIVDKRKELTDVSLPLLKGLDVKILGNKIKMTSYIKDSLRYLTGIDEVVNRGITQIQIDNQRN